mmetsp:Transcript_29991/g.50357  ORF Transcript_29991/g.50357 Transcript_29991/m.50357 type:complete len:379 (+) Transcript_29991:168-1304(+)
MGTQQALSRELLQQLKELEKKRIESNMAITKINMIHTKLQTVKTPTKTLRIADKAYRKLKDLYEKARERSEAEQKLCRELQQKMEAMLGAAAQAAIQTTSVEETTQAEQRRKKVKVKQEPSPVVTQPPPAPVAALPSSAATPSPFAQQPSSAPFTPHPPLHLSPVAPQPPVPAAVPSLSVDPNAPPFVPRPPVSGRSSSEGLAKTIGGSPRVLGGAFHLGPGDQVAALIGSKTTQAQWILAKIVRHLPDKDKYEIEDDDPGDDPENPQSKHHTIPSKYIVPLPSTNDSLPFPEFPKDSKVLAMFPDSTCFYKATVVAPPSRRQKQRTGAPLEYTILFEDDEEEAGAIIKRKVSYRFVVPHDGNPTWLNATYAAYQASS